MTDQERILHDLDTSFRLYMRLRDRVKQLEKQRETDRSETSYRELRTLKKRKLHALDDLNYYNIELDKLNGTNN